ncbi:MAG: iron-sulfur cluster assembly scaffold protein [Thermoplasmatales archaeon]|nr:MAG: iron-sulfur cluster assembly scaffold protein [Thermoplasmatales archaeon]
MYELGKKLLEHFQNPKNVGIIKNADGYARVKNPVCGDLTDMYIKVENERVKDVKFKTFGCLVTIASASALSEAVKEKKLDEILGSSDPIKMLMELIIGEFKDIPKEKLHCPPASIQALLMAISDYYGKNNEVKKVKKIDKALATIKCYYQEGIEEKR